MNPGPCCMVGRLKGANFMVALQRLRNLIEALQQAGATARVDLEPMLLARRRGNRLALEVNADPTRPLCEFDLRGQTIDNLLVDDNGQNSGLKAVGKEDVAK